MASTSAQATLSGRSSVQKGATVDFTDAKSRVTAVVARSGEVSSGVVSVEASQDGTVWVTLATLDMSRPENQFFSLNEGAFRYFRCGILSAVTGGGTVTATLMEGDR